MMNFRQCLPRLTPLLPILACLANAAPAAEPQLPAPAIGAAIDRFTLKGVGGKPWSLSDADDGPAVVIIFMGTECPLMKLYAQRLAMMADEFAEHGVQFVGINSNQQDGLVEIGAFAKTHQVSFPILKDPGNRVADQLGATRTPEVFVLDKRRRLRYHGCIDDQFHYGIQRVKADHEYLREALTALVAGTAVATEQTEPVGCQIGRILTPQPDSDVTYSRQISRILQKRCVECHREGEVAPFALTDYDEVVGWAGMIAEVVEQRRMPPWHANEQFGHFVNDARLTETERAQIARWVEAGAPEGDPDELPEPRQFAEGWRIGEPDRIISMAEVPFDVPAEGVVPYKHFVVDPGFQEDQWVQAAECRIGNRAVVHHIIVAVAPRDRDRAQVHGELKSDWLAATAPGARPMVLPRGVAKRIPAGSKLVFQMHYTPNGTPQKDLSSVGLVFADPETVKHAVATQKAINTRFKLLPGQDNQEVTAQTTIRHDSLLFSLFPHMHLRGKSFRYTANYPDGRSEVLLDIPRYDFNWQNTYEFAEPKRMPARTVIECVAQFDNSANNPANPDPTETVRWGDQTWQEMMIGYFDVALAEPISVADTRPSRETDRFLARVAAGNVETSKLASTAATALASQGDFATWCLELRKQVPQLARVDWMTVSDGALTVRRVAATTHISRAAAGVTVPAAPMHLADIASSGKLTVIPDTRAVKTPDFQLLQAHYGSSLHVPGERLGLPSVINFWSEEQDAFPPEAVSRLKTLAGKLAGASE